LSVFLEAASSRSLSVEKPACESSVMITIEDVAGSLLQSEPIVATVVAMLFLKVRTFWATGADWL